MTAERGRAAEAAPVLHHLALGSFDVEELAAFYCRLLSTTELKRQWDASGRLRSIWLNLSGTWLMLERAEPQPARPRVDGVGLGPFLLAFRADTAGRRAFEERAQQLGAPVEFRSAYTSYFRDPDGNRVAVSEYTETP